MKGEVDDLTFTRCAQADAPSERTLSTAELTLSIEGRVATLKPKGELRIAAFTGPLEGALTRADLAALTDARAHLVVYLGGLGGDLEVANQNLAALAALKLPVLFVPGGDDLYPVVEDAFDDLEGDAAQRLIDGSGLRALVIGKERFAIVPGAPLGRYALNKDACGFTTDDLEDIEAALSDLAEGRTWLLSWAAPPGLGVTRGYAGVETGNEALGDLAKALKAQGGLFAYPELYAALPTGGSGQGGFALVVPRLGRTGSMRTEGALLPRSLSVVRVDGSGLGLAGRP